MRHYWLTSDAPDLPGNAFKKAFGRNRPETLEGGKGGSAPEAPDPFKTAAATTQTNQQTAAYNKALNLNNYSGPFGSQQSVQTGTDPNTGAPIYGTTISANPQLQGTLTGLLGIGGQNYGATNQGVLNGLSGLTGNTSGYQSLAQGIGNNFQNYAQGALGLNPQYQSLSQNIGGLTGQFGNLNNQYAALGGQLNQGQAGAAQQQGQDAAYKAQTQYLDPQFAQQGESLAAQLANQGITPGSQAYQNAMTNFNNQKQQAYSNAQNQSILTGSQIGSQNLANQISGINTQAGLLGAQGQNLGAQAGLYGQQSGILGNQAGLYGLAGQLGSGQLSAVGQGLNAVNQQAGLYGQQLATAANPWQNLSSLSSLIPGYAGVGQSGAQAADIGGNINNAYQAQLANHNADVASGNQTMGTIGTIAGAAALAFF